MQKVNFQIEVQSSAVQAYENMLGLKNKSTYEAWTEVFNPTSTYEGNWNKGSKIIFVGIDEKGKRGGMVSRIAENIPNQFVSIEHYGMLDGENEITEGTEVESWAGAHENYIFLQQGDYTLITVEFDTAENFIDYFKETYPRALLKLKEVIEKSK